MSAHLDAANRGFAALQPYPFEKLEKLLAQVGAPDDLSPIRLSIGEPRHTPPEHVLQVYRDNIAEGVSRYPTIRGRRELRQACADWLMRRFGVELDADTMIQPVTGTREALFAAAQAFVRADSGQTVMMPNPFYQIYEGAALMAGATPDYLNVFAADNFLPVLEAIDVARLDRARLFYLCTPVNPCGTVASVDYLKQLLILAERHDFLVMADECYIELYRDEPPVSILNACKALGLARYERVLAFHSLSKRSNLPGMRSGFVAGDPALIADYARYRTYHGCSMSLAVQAASIAAWQDDAHVEINRAKYNEKYTAVVAIMRDAFDVTAPPASFYLWPKVGGDDAAWCQALYANSNVTVVPGSYLSRDVDGVNPGSGYVRISLVADLEETLEAARRIVHFSKHFGG